MNVLFREKGIEILGVLGWGRWKISTQRLRFITSLCYNKLRVSKIAVFVEFNVTQLVGEHLSVSYHKIRNVSVMVTVDPIINFRCCDKII